MYIIVAINVGKIKEISQSFKADFYLSRQKYTSTQKVPIFKLVRSIEQMKSIYVCSYWDFDLR